MSLQNWFWSEKFWFSDDVINKTNWKDIRDAQNGRSLLLSFPIGFLLVVLRHFVLKWISLTVGFQLCAPTKQKMEVPSNPVLENAYNANPKLDKNAIDILSKQTDMTSKEIEHWLRKREKLDNMTEVKRFSESAWRLIVKGSNFIFGCIILWRKSWAWETKQAWIDWPRHSLEIDVYWFYVLELAFYWHGLFSVLTEQKHNEFWLWLVHHVSSVVLIYFSWVLNLVRIGCMILLVHDAADPWLHIGRMSIYSKKQKLLGDIAFAVFAAVWLATKDGFFPFVILYSTTFDAPNYVGIAHHVYVLFNVFLYILMVLHLIWTYQILKIIIIKVTSGELTDNQKVTGSGSNEN